MLTQAPRRFHPPRPYLPVRSLRAVLAAHRGVIRAFHQAAFPGFSGTKRRLSNWHEEGTLVFEEEKCVLPSRCTVGLKNSNVLGDFPGQCEPKRSNEKTGCAGLKL